LDLGDATVFVNRDGAVIHEHYGVHILVVGRKRYRSGLLKPGRRLFAGEDGNGGK
jgi:hypothetical protein